MNVLVGILDNNNNTGKGFVVVAEVVTMVISVQI